MKITLDFVFLEYQRSS